MKTLRIVMFAAVCTTTVGITAASYRDVETTDVNKIESITPVVPAPAVSEITVADTVRDTTVPDTTVPDTTEPDTTVPDTTVPPTTSPSDLFAPDVADSTPVDITK